MSQAPLMVNLGCGTRVHASWSNFDLHPRAPGVVHCNFINGVPLAAGSASVVYCAAVLEHIRRLDVPKFLRECKRLLHSGGILRIAVPDFEAQARQYLKLLEMARSGDETAAIHLEWLTLEMIDQVGRDCSGGAMLEFLATNGASAEEFIKSRIGKEGGLLIEKLKHRKVSSAVNMSSYRTRMVRGGVLGVAVLKFLLRSKSVRRDLAALEVGRFRLFSGEVHQWVYDRASLVRLLSQVGFVETDTKDHGVSSIPDWHSYRLEIDENGRIEKPDLFIVECRKP